MDQQPLVPDLRGGPGPPPAAAPTERRARRDLAVVAVLAALMTLPLALARYPVAQDLSAHVETAAQIRALLADDPGTTATYVLHGLPWPNALPTMVLAALIDVMPGLTAARVLLGVGVLLWPIALAALFSRLGRPPLLAALALPTCFDLSFSYGFLHFVVGKPLWVATLILAVDLARRSGRTRAAALALALGALFCTHLMLFAAAVPLCAVLLLVLGPRGGARARVAAALAVGVAPALWWWWFARPAPTPGGAFAWRSPGQVVAQLWSTLGDLNPGAVDAVPWLLCGAGLVWALVDADGARAPRRETLALVAVVAAVTLFALGGPTRTPHVSVVAERFFSVAAALAVGLPARAPARRARLAITALAAIAAVVAVVDVTRHWRAFGRDEMGDFDQLLAQVPAGSRVATHFVTPFSPHGNHNAAWHWPKLVALGGSETDDSFAWRSTCVVGLRPGRAPARQPRLDDRELAAWDFVLVRGASTATDRVLAQRALDLVFRTGSWRLFRVRVPAVDHPR